MFSCAKRVTGAVIYFCGGRLWCRDADLLVVPWTVYLVGRGVLCDISWVEGFGYCCCIIGVIEVIGGGYWVLMNWN